MQGENHKEGNKALPASSAPVLKPEWRDGWYVLPANGRVVTNELIKQIQQQLDDEEVAKSVALATKKHP